MKYGPIVINLVGSGVLLVGCVLLCVIFQIYMGRQFAALHIILALLVVFSLVKGNSSLDIPSAAVLIVFNLVMAGFGFWAFDSLLVALL